MDLLLTGSAHQSSLRVTTKRFLKEESKLRVSEGYMSLALSQTLYANAQSCQAQIYFLFSISLSEYRLTFASSRVFPVAPVLAILSLPAYILMMR